LLLALAGLAISFAAPAIAQQKDTVDPQIAQQTRALASKYDAAFNNNDAAAVAALYTDDGANGWHGTSHGRQAIEKAYAHDFQSWHPHSRFTTVGRISAVGNEVRSTGRWSCVHKSWSGTPGNADGHYSWVFVRKGDTWKIRRDTYDITNRGH
jgi:uncharacterized protein (TIGR02246 family)